MENTRTHTNKGMYYLALITCAIFVLSEYCPELHILDQLHFKHILLSIAVFIFGWDLIDNRKNRCLVYEVKQILTCVGILYFITVIFQVKNMEFKSYSLGEVYYLIAPLLLVWIFFNYISLDRIANVIDVLFYASCIAFFVRFANTFSLAALKQISFIDSSSPFESDMAQFFLLYCFYYFYTRQTWKSTISVILCFLCFKRFTLVMLIILLIINKFIPHYKKVPKIVLLITMGLFIAAPFLVYAMCTDSFARWFYLQFGIDFDYFTMTRFQIINTVIDANLTNYGLGTVTNYLEQRGAAGQLNMHNDILRIYMECTIVGTITFTVQYFKIVKDNIFSFLVMLYAFMELFVAHYIGPGTTSFWIIAYILIFYFNIMENSSDKSI
ncbi:hypothetical protein DXB77_08070 [Clostridium sp. OM05-9]|uniref:hypothetical protein n=1 Tax=Clostridium sp. OM05-9 TaxID=2293045 RepID=UPI000E46B6A9|nr:hypothetical protein [Clostridium sp. OM05-9]RHV11123.1 hypothetical protein DXB77_08070 [Clostridium sp. OM05-9]